MSDTEKSKYLQDKAKTQVITDSIIKMLQKYESNPVKQIGILDICKFVIMSGSIKIDIKD